MAIEFRERSWTDDIHLSDTITFLRHLRAEGVVLIASDDLEHEMHQSDRGQLGPSGHRVKQMPIVSTAQCCPLGAYVRIHRRWGNHRVLSEEEIEAWNTTLLYVSECIDEWKKCQG
jgi:uncharacterized protein YecE (DUF72 family)